MLLTESSAATFLMLIVSPYRIATVIISQEVVVYLVNEAPRIDRGRGCSFTVSLIIQGGDNTTVARIVKEKQPKLGQKNRLFPGIEGIY